MTQDVLDVDRTTFTLIYVCCVGDRQVMKGKERQDVWRTKRNFV